MQRAKEDGIGGGWNTVPPRSFRIVSISANVAEPEAARSAQIFIGHALHTQTKTPDSGSYDVINGPLRNARKFPENLTPIRLLRDV